MPIPSASSTPLPGVLLVRVVAQDPEDADVRLRRDPGSDGEDGPGPALRARARRGCGVSAASSGVRRSSAGIGSSPSPSRQTYRSFAVTVPSRLASAVLHDQRELLRIEARAADERAVDLRVRHELADVARLHAPAVLDPDPGRQPVVVPRRERLADSLDDPAGVGRLGVPARCRSPRSARRRSRPMRASIRFDTVERPPELLGHLRLGAAGVALLQGLPHAQDRRHPGAKTARTFLLTSASSSPKSWRRSECPTITYGDPERLQHRR